MAKLLLKCYLIMLICTATLTVGFYVVAAYYASRIDSVVEDNWDNPQFQVRIVENTRASVLAVAAAAIPPGKLNLTGLSSDTMRG